MQLILVRHGETEWNRLGKYQGHSDIALNDKGREQARMVGSWMLNWQRGQQTEVLAIYTSDLARAIETGDVIRRMLGISNNNIFQDDRIRELSFGLWEGLTFTEVYENYREQFDCWYNDTQMVKIPGGESIADMTQRSLELLKNLATDNKIDGTIIVVTHGGTIKALLNHFDNRYDLWDTTIKPGSITMISSKRDSFEIQEVGVVIDI
ncbi:histidine phosphatase family protein [Desulfuribacillus alkaliarsenatis]|uniref:Alpha-ribazole phosphatase n=1 Tax=Desulfuribacillus alkaliarsenatis TaxID=766136 RepID=A0A1E5G4G4_9FIRM|nr:histidine phosphatase family protein [Desulfuribacillus alkaliarsenatis]OEF97985.1 hypothetical protein BHF68_13025 [Desulfuribacillus alkaliarsenatis]